MNETTKTDDVAGPAVDPLRARRAAAEAKLAKAAEKKDETTQLRELALLEKRAEFTEKGGEEGVDFKVVDAGAAGPIVLELPAQGRMVMLKRFRKPIDDPKDGKITLENSIQFVTPCVVFPERTTFLELVDKHPGLAYDLANELHAMFGRNEATERGK